VINLGNQFSKTARDIIKRLLVCDPDERLTAEKALEHPFITNPLYLPFTNLWNKPQIIGFLKLLYYRSSLFITTARQRSTILIISQMNFYLDNHILALRAPTLLKLL